MEKLLIVVTDKCDWTGPSQNVCVEKEIFFFFLLIEPG
jgi:hypothetical protein